MSAMIRLLAALLAAFGLHSARSAAPSLAHVRSIRIHSATGITTSVTRPKDVRRIVKRFDALPAFVPRPCPYAAYQPPAVRFDFRAADGSVVLRAVDHA